jgi:inhibitor of KinA sporulation pathway (predicted exonuclease)
MANYEVGSDGHLAALKAQIEALVLKPVITAARSYRYYLSADDTPQVKRSYVAQENVCKKVIAAPQWLSKEIEDLLLSLEQFAHAASAPRAAAAWRCWGDIRIAIEISNQRSLDRIGLFNLPFDPLDGAFRPTAINLYTAMKIFLLTQ